MYTPSEIVTGFSVEEGWSVERMLLLLVKGGSEGLGDSS